MRLIRSHEGPTRTGRADATRRDAMSGYERLHDKGGSGIATRTCAATLTHPFATLYQWVARLGDAVGWNLVLFIGSCHFCLKGMLMGLAHQAGLPFAQQYLKLSATDMQRYGIVAYFPWSLKPVFGMLSDVVPIGGYNKRYYMTFVSALGAAALVFLGGAQLGEGDAMIYVTALVFINLQVSVVDLLTEGKYTEKMRQLPEMSGDIVSFVWFSLLCGGLFATIISFFTLRSENYRVMFWCAIPFSAQCVFTSYFGLMPEPAIESSKRVCVGPANRELVRRHQKIFTLGTFMGLACAVNAAAQLMTSNMYAELVITASVAIALSFAMFWAMPPRLAKATLFLFLTNTVSVSFGSAMQYWFTVDEECNPGGPHFDYLFFTVYTAVVAQVFSAVGIWLFNRYFVKFRMRRALMISAVISSVSSIGDLALVLRWNKAWGIPDKAFYLLGDTILEPAVGMMAYMPCTVLMSKVRGRRRFRFFLVLVAHFRFQAPFHRSKLTLRITVPIAAVP